MANKFHSSPLMAAKEVKPGATQIGTPVKAEVIPAWKDPVVIFNFLVSINAFMTMFLQQGLTNLVITDPHAAQLAASWLMFFSGVITILLKTFFSKNPVSFKN
jgi:hypothetical protein